MTTTTFPPPAPVADARGASSSPLVIQGLIKRYGRKLVLAGVDLIIPTGSVTGLLAKNGEGKTTLIKSMLGLIKTDAGEVRVLGERPRELSADAKARIGYVPQVVTLYPWMRPKQLLSYTAAFYPNWNQRLAEQLLRDWRVDPETKVGALSVGTLQKLSIILALAHEPELMILDEPAAALDPQARRDFLKALLDVAADGRRTILFSTHITSDLERVADSVAILRAGRIAYHGALDELKDSVKRLHIVVPANVTPEQLAAAAPGVTRSQVEGGEALLSVRTSAVEHVAEQIEQKLGAMVRVEDLSLEDIFLELHHG